jgi:hypothetical protein
MSEEPLIDDIEEDASLEKSLVDSFIDQEVSDLLAEDRTSIDTVIMAPQLEAVFDASPPDDQAKDMQAAPIDNGQQTQQAVQEAVRNIWGDAEPMSDFPSMNELTSLSHQLARLKQRQMEQEEDSDEEKGGVKVTE